MVEAIILFLRALFFASLFCLVMGFFRPVYVLWFLGRCSRLKVLKLYGTLALVFFLAYSILEHVEV